jgi:hypothetical protein
VKQDNIIEDIENEREAMDNNLYSTNSELRYNNDI